MKSYQRILSDGRANRRDEHAFYIDATRGYILRAVLIVTHIRNGAWAVLSKNRERFVAHEDDIYTRQELKDFGLEESDIPWPVPGGIST